MSAITHHIPDAMLAAYASGSLPHAYALVVAAHVSYCTECRAALAAHNSAGGAVLESMRGTSVSDALRQNVFAQLDDPVPAEPARAGSGVFPAPVWEALNRSEPRWKTLGMGVRQAILSADRESSARLLYIPGGQAVPDHGHNGLELTLVLQGSFSDETGRFGVGDVEIGTEDLVHTPTADAGPPCICLAATDAPLRFNSFIPRLLQPLFRI